MKIFLVIYTGLFVGLVCTTILYTFRKQMLDSTVTNVTEEEIRQTMAGYRVHGEPLVGIRNCYQTVVKCPEGETDCRCQEMCGQGFEKTEVDEMVYLDQKLEPGRSYCLPQRLIPCNPKLGTLVYGGGHYTCLCRFPDVYGGTACSERKGCLKGVLKSKATGKPVDKHDLVTGDYYCSCEMLDHRQNKMINMPGNELECFSDPCLRWVTHAREKLGFDVEEGVCRCGDVSVTRLRNIMPGEEGKKTPCSSCYIEKVDQKTYKLPLRCAGMNSKLNKAPPCKDFLTLNTECENVIVEMEIE